jgi:hypothetical protein
MLAPMIEMEAALIDAALFMTRRWWAGYFDALTAPAPPAFNDCMGGLARKLHSLRRKSDCRK